MSDRTYRDAIAALAARHDSDIPPEQATALDLGSGLPPWGWTDDKSEIGPPESSFFRGMVIAVPVALWLWVLLIWGIAIWAGWRPFRGWLPW